jgi:hypothetical protein
MHVKCESEGHTNNNRPTLKYPLVPKYRERPLWGKNHITDESFTNTTPTNTATNGTENTYTNQILSLLVR